MEKFSQSSCWSWTAARTWDTWKDKKNLCTTRWDDRKKKNRGNETGPTPVVGAEEEMFPHLGKRPCKWGDQLGQRAASGAWRRAHQPVCNRQVGVRCTRMAHVQSRVPRPGTRVSWGRWGRALESGVWRVGYGSGLLLAPSVSGQEWGVPQRGMLME